VHDVVIVGAGAAGCVLASRLSEDPSRSVLLLEAGTRSRRLETRIPAAFSKLFRSPLDWGDSTTPQTGLDGREIVFPRGRALGGSTVLNAMIVLRGQRGDYDDWAARGCAGWAWADVEPAFAQSAAGSFAFGEQREPHVLSEAFVHAAQACGIPLAPDLNAEVVDGVGVLPVSQRRGRRFGVLDGYLSAALRRPNLTVVTDAHATRVVLDGGRARGVVYKPGAGRRDEEEALASEVVVCAGAVGSPHLLQLSGIGPREALEQVGVEVVHDLPGVGEHLLDHLASGLFVKTKGVETLASAQSLRNLVAWALRGRGPLTSNIAEAAALVRTSRGAQVPDLELLFAPVLFVDEGLTQPTEHGLTLGVILLHPRSSGTVRLRSADPFERPLIDPRYLSDPGGEDVTTLLRGLRLARRVVAQEPLASFVDRELDPGVDARTDEALLAHVRALSQTLYHPVGTCRMGTDSGAVVDPQFRVRGIDGLRVADASVMPSLPSGHTNWPTVMIAERAAASMSRG
jgi:choline dehydrogenase